MTSVLSIDFETRSTVDLKKCGVYVYAEHADTDIWCMAWAFDDEEPEIWTPDMAFKAPYGLSRHTLPARVLAHVEAGGEVRAWNAQFERVIWRSIMVPRYGAPPIRDAQFVCSAAEAAAMALPRALGQAAKVLGVEEAKDDEGYQLMLRMSRPRKIREDGSPTWWDVEDRKQRLFAYCKQDVRTERAITKALRRLTPHEREIYLLDQRVNDRGVRVDLPLVQAARSIVGTATARANARLETLTGGAVSKISHNGRLLAYLNENGVETASIGKPAVAALLERDDLADTVTEILELRAEAGRSSVAKLVSMQSVACADGRARGLLLYHGASTGRWTGKLLQPQNFPRGEVANPEQYIDDVLAGHYDALDMIAPPVVIVLSMLRSMLTADPARRLVAGDFSAIEARVLNWLAGQDDVCAAFRAYDAATKADKPKFDPYRIMAVRMRRGLSPELVTKEDRQAGKAAELGCGFQMGAEKFVKAAWDVYQVAVTLDEAKAAVTAYRDSHDRVVALWRETQDACMAAVRKPGVAVTFGGRRNLKALRSGAYLYVVLPSGRPLVYAAPSVEEREVPWSTPEKPETRPALHFWGVDSFSRQWGKMAAYGGLLVENITQAVARDLMADAMLRVEAAGYLPVMSVHDEVVCEAPEGFGSVQDFERLMSEVPAWGAGCPVAAEAWAGFRYRK